MKQLGEFWLSRSLIVLVFSIVVGWLMFHLELSDLAGEINKSMIQSESGGQPPQVLRYILPLVKEFVFIGVPLALTLLLRRLYRLLISLGQRGAREAG